VILKNILIFGLVSVLFLPLLAMGCDGSAKEASPTPTPLAGSVEITLHEFEAQHDKLVYIEATFPGTVTVRLGANPTTGYIWAVTEIVHPEVIGEGSNDFEGPTATSNAGAGGTEVWVFNTTDTGLAIIRMSYSQPWAGGEKDLYTVSINVNIR
jgi:inhibitor of cysteine peptidase